MEYNLSDYATVFDTPTISQVADFFAGVFMGFVLYDNLYEIQQCLTDLGSVEQKIIDIWTTLSAGITVESILAAVNKIIGLYQDWPKYAGHCEDIQGDIAKVEDWFTGIDTEKIPINIAKHLGAIKTDINTMNADFAAGSFDSAGKVAVDLAFLVLNDPRSRPFTEWRLSS